MSDFGTKYHGSTNTKTGALGGFQIDAHQIAQLARWIVFAGMTAAALIMFGVVVSRRVGYIRLGRSTQDGDGRAAGSRHDPEAEEEDDEQFLHLSAAASYPKRSKDAGARRILQSVQTFEFRRALGWAVHVFGHRKLLKDIRSGLLHAVLFYGFIVLQFGAADIIWKGLSGHTLPLPAYHDLHPNPRNNGRPCAACYHLCVNPQVC